MLWVLIQPLTQFGLQAYAFKYIVRIQHEDYLLFLLSGLLPWIFVASSIEMCATTFIYQSPVFKSIVINPTSFVAAQVLDNFLVLTVGLGFGCLTLSLIGSVPPHKLSLLLPALLPLFIFTAAMSTLVATFQVFLRDLRFVISFALSSLYFITPVIYPIDFVPESHRWVFSLNPLHQMILPFRSALFESVSQFSFDLFHAFLIAAIAAGIAGLVWRRHANDVVYHV